HGVGAGRLPRRVVSRRQTAPRYARDVLDPLEHTALARRVVDRNPGQRFEDAGGERGRPAPASRNGQPDQEVRARLGNRPEYWRGGPGWEGLEPGAATNHAPSGQPRAPHP